MEETKQHVQVPKMNLKKDNLKNIDPYVYAWLKRHMNAQTKSAFPSITTLVGKTGLYRETISASIERLEKAGYIKVIKQVGKQNVYVFNDYKKFEIFSYDFLDNPDLTPKNKAYLVIAQQHMFKDFNKQTGSIKYDNEKLIDLLNLSPATMKKQEKELIQKGVLSIVPTNQLELIEVGGQMIPKSGLYIDERIYDFGSFCNLLALKFQQQDEVIEEHSEKIDDHEDRIKALEQQIAKLQEENERKDKLLQNAKIIL